MPFDYRKLRGRIVEVYGSQSNFAREFGLSGTAFSRKLNNKIRFSVDDIIKIVKMLKIPLCEIGEYFFTVKV